MIILNEDEQSSFGLSLPLDQLTYTPLGKHQDICLSGDLCIGGFIGRIEKAFG